MTWESSNGIVLRDLVPAALRRRWIERGHCPDRDLYALYAEQERAHPDRPAVVGPCGTVSYRELGRYARHLAGRLHAAGLGPRDIIAIQLRDDWQALAADLSVAALGAVSLPIAGDRGHRDTLRLLRRSRASAAITAEPAALERLRPELPCLRTVSTPAELAGGPPRASAAEPGLEERHPTRAEPGLEHTLAGTGPDGYAPTPVDAEAPARILVTSGTETEPKLIVYSHNAMAGGRGNYLAAIYDETSTGGAGQGRGTAGAAPVRGLLLVPLSSSYGSLGIVTLVRHGGTLVLLEKFDPGLALRAIGEHRPTHLFGVPTMLRRMLASGEAADTSSLRTVVSSAMMLDQACLDACRRRFGCAVVNVYGSADGVNCHTARGGAGLGRPDPAAAEIRITEQGEICARGPMTPLCYVNAPELDARYRTPGGWVRTGDRGFLDPDGNLHLVDRLKQIVIRGGYNISVAEVERHLYAHPAVADAACVPVPDGDLGERLCACVVPRPGAAAPSLPELTGFLETGRGLGRRKLPELLVVLGELPLGPTGKLCRRTLSRLAADLVPSRSAAR